MMNQFVNRIWENNRTNCGLTIQNVRINDTGTFKVKVEFLGGSRYIQEEFLAVSEDAGELYTFQI